MEKFVNYDAEFNNTLGNRYTKKSGKYLITTKYHEVEVDMWFGVPDNYGDNWERHYDEDVIAWCLIENIEPFKF